MNSIKKFLPFIILIIFIILIYNFYLSNKKEFIFLQNINLNLILIVIILCFLYLITEGYILRNIVIFLNSKISLRESFLIMNATYFCNTFIQFSGLGYRVYYLNKYKKLEISKILRLSIDTIVCELFIFSLFGLISLLFIDNYSSEIQVNIYLYSIFLFFVTSSLVYLLIFQTLINKFHNFIDLSKKKKFIKFIKFFYLTFNNKLFYLRQFLLFSIQYILLFCIFFVILDNFQNSNAIFLSLLITSLVDFSFLIAFTPYSVGISEFITFFGTRSMSFSLPEIIILVNIFRIGMLLIYFIFGPAFFLIKMLK